MNPSFIIDTNIIIQFEDTANNNEIKPLFARLHELFTKHNLSYYYHPQSEQDFNSDQDDIRKIESLSRLKKYPKLNNPPTIEETTKLEELFGNINKSNDLIDSQILYSIERNCASFLISEDKGIRKRARYRGIDERILNCKEAIELIERLFEEKEITHPRVNHDYCYNIDLEDSFFNSLRADYDGFNKWFLEKCCQQQRRCFTITNDDKLAGICIYKKEAWKKIKKPSIKLSTFKISENFEGRKYGELLLKVAFEYAIEHDINTIWLTTYSKQEKLIYFLKEFGFRVHPDLDGEQLVFVKQLFVPDGVTKMKPLDFHKQFYPFYYDSSDIEKYVIPIKPNFYRTLFPENELGQLEFNDLNTQTTIAGNTIRKVYLCHAKKKAIPEGSLIIFYVTSPHSLVCTLGIVEKTNRFNDEESLASAIGKRSVYTKPQVEEMIKKEVLVINFRVINHFDGIELDRLVDEGILKGTPQSVGQIEHRLSFLRHS